MTAPFSLSTASERRLGPAFDPLPRGLVLVAAPPSVGKTCLSLSLGVHEAAHEGKLVLYISAGTPKEVILTRLAKNLTPEGQPVDLAVLEGLPLVVRAGMNPTCGEVIEAVAAFVRQEGQPDLVLINDLQDLRPTTNGLSGRDAAIEILADLRGLAETCEAPVVLFSHLTPGKEVAPSVAEQADRVVTISLLEETPTHKRLSIGFQDPPEPESGRYELCLIRSTGVVCPA